MELHKGKSLFWLRGLEFKVEGPGLEMTFLLIES